MPRLRKPATSPISPVSDTPLVDKLNDLSRWGDQLSRIDQDRAGLPAAIRQAADQRDLDELTWLYQRQDQLDAERATLLANRDELVARLRTDAEAAITASTERYTALVQQLQTDRQQHEQAVTAAVDQLTAALTGLVEHPVQCRGQLSPLEAEHRQVHDRYQAVQPGWTPLPATPLTSAIEGERRRAIIEGLLAELDRHRVLPKDQNAPLVYDPRSRGVMVTGPIRR